ncbi:COP9 signalosome complex subunit 7b [Galdieria sulphuraria]|nr:COP9 signalosome complex subunit 7b [Galdieria sulphuraria]
MGIADDSLKGYLENLRVGGIESAQQIIQQLLEDPNVHVFGEVLLEPTILQLKQDGAQKDWVQLLEIFAYGTWRDGQNGKLWNVISDEAKRKLKRLTVVQLASKQKQLNYSDLMETLGLVSVRELEDLLMDCIEYRLMRGRLDQKQQLFQVEWTMGRDVSDSQLKEMIDSFYRWETNAQLLLEQLDSQMAYIQKKETEFEMERTHTIKQVESVQRQSYIVQMKGVEEIKEPREDLQPYIEVPNNQSVLLLFWNNVIFGYNYFVTFVIWELCEKCAGLFSKVSGCKMEISNLGNVEQSIDGPKAIFFHVVSISVSDLLAVSLLP